MDPTIISPNIVRGLTAQDVILWIVIVMVVLLVGLVWYLITKLICIVENYNKSITQFQETNDKHLSVLTTIQQSLVEFKDGMKQVSTDLKVLSEASVAHNSQAQDFRNFFTEKMATLFVEKGALVNEITHVINNISDKLQMDIMNRVIHEKLQKEKENIRNDSPNK